MPKRIAMLLSTESFEGFFGRLFGLDVTGYVKGYRNDFSWYYAKMLLAHDMVPYIYIPSVASSGLWTTEEGIQVRMIPIQPWYPMICRWPIFRGAFGRYAREVLNAQAFLSALKRDIKHDEIDVLYIQEYWTGRFDRLVAALSGRVPIVAADHGGTKAHRFTGFKRITFAKADHLTSQTSAEYSQIQTLTERVVCLPNPVDTTFFQSGDDISGTKKNVGKHILTVARLTDTQKNTSVLIRAMQSLDAEWFLTIAGDGPDRAMLEQLAKDCNVESRVKFVGFVTSREKLRQLYRSCDVFCLPSAHEGLPMVVLEAMSCGLPVVVTEIQAYADIIENGVHGLRVPVGGSSALALAIVQAFRDREKLGAQARSKIMQGYSEDRFMETFATLL